jgi:hypothetical protein
MKVSVGGKKFSAIFVDNNPDAVLREKKLKLIVAVVMRIGLRRFIAGNTYRPARQGITAIAGGVRPAGFFAMIGITQSMVS